jgi:hypothetical protein
MALDGSPRWGAGKQQQRLTELASSRGSELVVLLTCCMSNAVGEGG